MADHKVIDNFLPSDVFDKLYNYLLPQSSELSEGGESVNWCYVPSVAMPFQAENWRFFYLTHVIYAHTIVSPLFETIIPHVEKPLDIKALIRIKINMFPNTEKIHEHGMHTDHDFPHKAALFSINTCDGYTKLEDGTKINSVANRVLLFDASNSHSSTTTTDQPVRVNINFNYF